MAADVLTVLIHSLLDLKTEGLVESTLSFLVQAHKQVCRTLS